MFRSDTLMAALAFSALGLGCSSAEDPAATSTSGAGGAGGTSAATTTNAATSSDATTGATTTATSAVASTTGVGGAPPMFVCDPPAEAGSLWEIEDVSYDLDAIDPVSMCKYRGDVLLIVNTAAV